jgi:hypothetical protein
VRGLLALPKIAAKVLDFQEIAMSIGVGMAAVLLVVVAVAP